MMNKTKIVFFGTPNLAVFALEEMKELGIKPDVIVTAPDARAGRGRILTAAPVKIWSDENEIKTLQPKLLDSVFIDEVARLLAEPKDEQKNKEKLPTKKSVFIVFAYGKILSKEILDIPTDGTLNIHPSMLPKLRGPSPIRTAILHDEVENLGLSIIKLDRKMDHGPILIQKLYETHTWPQEGHILDEELSRMGGEMMAKIVPEWISGKIETTKQLHTNASFCHFLEKKDGEINLDDDDYPNYLKYCAMDGWPGTFFFKNGKRIKITKAHFENDKFIIDRVIQEGKKESDFKNI